MRLKGTDRFYAWSDALSHQKKKGLSRFFNVYLHLMDRVMNKNLKERCRIFETIYENRR
ncbi:hypothetical protein EMIT019CA3_100021 [Bacillus pseudomycoides]